MQRTADRTAAWTVARIAGAAIICWLVGTPVPVLAVSYSGTVHNIDTTGAGYQNSDVALGDYNNDGRLDVVANGTTSGAAGGSQLRVFTNNGTGGFNAAINVTPANQGLQNGSVAWGDFDNDGQLDILTMGTDYNGAYQLRVYFVNNPATNSFTAVDVPGAAGAGMNLGQAVPIDYDNDGDLDILVAGTTNGGAGGAVLRIYPNLGNRKFGAPITVDATNNGLYYAGVAVGDFSNDGFMDFVAEGQQTTTNTRQIRVYLNNGHGGFNAPSMLTVPTLGGGLSRGRVAVGDLNNDGALDIVASGSTNGTNGNSRLIYFLNNGSGAFPATGTLIANVGYRGGVAVGNTDNNGPLDILVSGYDNGGAGRLRVYKNSGATPTPAFAVTTIVSNNYIDGGVAFGDLTNTTANGAPDRRIEIVGSGYNGGGTRRFRYFTNTIAAADTAPNPPTTLSSTFTFSVSGVSTATFKWNPGTDTEGPATNNMFGYDLQVSTTSGFTGVSAIPVAGSGVAGAGAASPLRGNYYRPPRIYDGNTNHGVLFVSTSPWLAGAAPCGLRTDTTYYYRVRTYDNGLIFGNWNATAGTLWTGVAPASSTIGAYTGPSFDNITISWNSAGDDATKGNLTGNYRVQYSTVSTTAWSMTSTPPLTFTTTTVAANVIPGTPQSVVLSGLQNGATYFFVLWTQDDVGLWSLISNTTSTWAGTGSPIPPGKIRNFSATTGASPGQIGLSWLASGDDAYQPITWAAAYDMRYSTTASQSPALSDANFNAAPSVWPDFIAGLPSPSVEGTTDTVVLSNMLEGTTYYFAIKARDNINNWSPLSAGATTWALRDTTPPARIGSLFATADPSPGEIMLSWTATGDDGAVGTAARHDIRYSTIAANSPALSDALFNLAASVTDFVAIPPPSPAGTPESLDITGLLEGVTYYFAIKAADENPNWSPLSNGATAQAHVTTRDITLDVSGYNFGNVTLGLSTQTTAAVTVSYDGNVNSTFRIYAATITAGSPWTLGTTQGPDRAVLFAGFNSDLPLLSDFIGTNVVLNTSQICDANWFVLDTDCVGVTPATDLTLWFRLDMPTTSSVVAEQQIQVTVEAGSP